MQIDTTTLLIAAGAVVAVAGVSFILSTALRRNERFGRIWSIAFIAGILETISEIVAGTSPAGWWAGSVANGALVLAIGLMWAGCRAYNGLRSLAWVAIVTSNVVAIAGLIQGPAGGYWTGAGPLFISIIAFGALAGYETARGNLRRNVDARALTIVFWVVSIYYLFRFIAFIAAGPESEVFRLYFGTETTTFAAIILVIVAAIAMTAIQPVSTSRNRNAAPAARGRTIPGVVDDDQFENQAADWLVRARRDKESLVLLAMSVDGLEHINSAFGREFGEQTIYAVGRTACENSPSAALIAHTGGGRFVILTSAPAIGSAASVAEKLQTALVETPVDAAKGIRALATYGIATTDDLGYDLIGLTTAATTALLDAQADSQPGAIRLA